MKRTLIMGAAYVDVVVNVPNLPVSGSDVTGQLMTTMVGGSAFNVYGAMRYAQAPADLFVPVGQGQYAQLVREQLRTKQIPELLTVDEADNGWDMSLVEPSGERSFLTIPGIDQVWRDDWFDRVQLTDYAYVYLSGYQLEDAEMAERILTQIRRQAPDTIILFDASPRMVYLKPKTVAQLLQPNVIIHCNETEFRYFAASEQPMATVAAQIYQQTKQPVIITLGERGTYYYDHGNGEVIASERVPVVNTIGAGDTHCGGMLAGLATGQSLPAAIKSANQLAAKVVSQQAGSLL